MQLRIPFIVMIIGGLVLLAHALLGLWCYSYDACHLVASSVSLVQDGVFPLAGLHFLPTLRLGPLADYVAALPLAVFGSVRAIYIFAGMSCILSVVIFAVYAGRMLSAKAAGWAIFAYASSVALVTRMAAQINECFLMPLVALLFWCILEGRRKSGLAFLVYPLVALAAQFHITALFMLPTAWAVWRIGARRFRFKLHAAGNALVLASFAPLVFHYATGSEPLGMGSLLCSIHPLSALLSVILAIPLAFIVVPISIIFLLPAILSALPQLKTRGLLNILLPPTIVYLLVTAIAASFKNWMTVNYYLCILPFLAFLSGLVAEAALKDRRKSTHFVLVTAAVLLTLSLAVGGSLINIKVYSQSHPVRSLDAQIYYLHNLHHWLLGNDSGLSSVEEVFFRDTSNGHVSEIVPSSCFEGLRRIYLRPQSQSVPPRDYEVWMMRIQDEASAIEARGEDAPRLARWTHGNAVFHLYPVDRPISP